MLLQSGARFDLRAYLAHIGFAGTPRSDAATLRAICRLHPMAIPFENLTPLSGQPVPLDIEALQAKMIGRGPDGLRRGGYCFEQNTLLAHALDAAGFAVTGLSARVLWNRPAGVTTPQTHMVLRVRADGADFLADAGFGSVTLTAPLRMAAGAEQDTPHETFRLGAEADGNLLLEARIAGGWRAIYRLGPEPRVRADYEIVNYYVSTHPRSRFRNNLVVSRPFEGGRRTLFNLDLSEYRRGAAPSHRTLTPSEAETALEDVFGLAIPDRDALHAMLARTPDAAEDP